jgi:YfiH family protein
VPLRSLPTSSTTTRRSDGDFSPSVVRSDHDSAELDARRRRVVDRPWVWLRQVHGATVLEVDGSSIEAVCGREADALVTTDPSIALAIHTADCAPVVLVDAKGIMGAAHVGWRGLEAGVLAATVSAMSERGADRDTIAATIGPCIGPECYEFGAADRTRLGEQFGPEVAATTSWGTPALDLAGGVRLALAHLEVTHVTELPPDERCTACHPDRYYSYRARGETGRMATVVWSEP